MNQKRNSKRRARDPIWKVVLYMFFMGLAAAFAFAHAYNFAVKIGLSPAASRRLPSYAFVAGVGLGAFRFGREGFKTLLLAAAFWWVAWMLGIGVGALLILLGASTAVADWCPPILFWVSVVLTAIALFAGLQEKLEVFMSRHGVRRTN